MCIESAFVAIFLFTLLGFYKRQRSDLFSVVEFECRGGFVIYGEMFGAFAVQFWGLFLCHNCSMGVKVSKI